jgi:hypothetical protein
MIMNIKDFLNKSKFKYYNLAIFCGMLSGELDKDIFIKANGGNAPAAFTTLRKLRDFKNYCELNGCDGFPIPLFNGQIAKCFDYLAVFIYLNHPSVDFVEVDKEYEPTNFDEKWLKSFLNLKEVNSIKEIYSSLLSHE